MLLACAREDISRFSRSYATLTLKIAEPTIQQLEAEDADATVVDGDGLGAGCVDHLNHRGYGKRLL